MLFAAKLGKVGTAVGAGSSGAGKLRRVVAPSAVDAVKPDALSTAPMVSAKNIVCGVEICTPSCVVQQIDYGRTSGIRSLLIPELN